MLSFLRRLASLAAAPPPLMLLSPSCCFLALNPLWSRYRCCRCWSAQALQLRLRPKLLRRLCPRNSDDVPGLCRVLGRMACINIPQERVKWPSGGSGFRPQ